MEIKMKGGKRVGAGRKPTSNPKLTITLYVERSNVLKFGSPEKLKEKVYTFITGFGEHENEKNGTLIPEKPLFNQPIIQPEVRKSVSEWIVEKREILLPEQYEEFIDRLNKCKYLTDKQKHEIKYA